MPANSCSSLSDSPPMVSLALKKGIRTNRIVRSSMTFSVNWLSFASETSKKTVLNLAKSWESDNSPDKLNGYGIAYSLVRGIPVLHDACAYAICKVVRKISAGDHDLFIASVSEARAIADFRNDGYWRFEDYKPILYLGSVRSDPLTTI